MFIDKVIVEKRHCFRWISDSEVKIIKEINERVFIETFIGRLFVLGNYFFMMKLVKTTGGEFLPNYSTESSKYVVLLTWIAYATIILISVVQLILKSRIYKEDVSLDNNKVEYYNKKLLNRSVRVFILSIFYLIIYQIFFQITMEGVNISATILWWIIILNLIILIYMGLGRFRYYINLENLNSSLEEVALRVEKGNYKNIKTRLYEKFEKEDRVLNGNEFEITYKAIEELIDLSKNVEFKAEGSLISKTELITNVSHDLKTPLTSIINYVDFLKKGNLDREDKKSYIDILSRKSKRLKVLIDDLKESTEASEGNIKLECEDIDLVELLNSILLEFKDKIENSLLDFEFNVVESTSLDFDIAKSTSGGDSKKIIRKVYADQNKMLRVFQNIISNILKYSQDNSKVNIQFEQGESITLARGYYTRITFKNACKNIININGEELLERFRRGDSSRNTEGSGLGLNIAKSLVEAQGGEFKINIENNIFTISVIF